FMIYAVSRNLPSEDKGAFYVDDEGRTWFAPVEGGLYWRKENQTGQVTIAGLDKDVVYSITGSNNEFWLGRQRGGLTHLKYKDGSFRAETYTRAEGLAQNSIYAVHQSRDRSVWAGSISGGVSRLKDG